MAWIFGWYSCHSGGTFRLLDDYWDTLAVPITLQLLRLPYQRYNMCRSSKVASLSEVQKLVTQQVNKKPTAAEAVTQGETQPYLVQSEMHTRLPAV
ncbi:NADH-ubiquinone oxidoreductase, subunit G [Aspergillus luchuensis]|uniref:NADH-ubiquinone oxidoreductase, subunit G n=1 Tax=Aspergillus kawachii TaxID=1069201 RepID=A0A146F6Z8_ASPKA|nr:NADH-ubiquinone oxidoreductase, subunit G [Aspergillus luchuensis]